VWSLLSFVPILNLIMLRIFAFTPGRASTRESAFPWGGLSPPCPRGPGARRTRFRCCGTTSQSGWIQVGHPRRLAPISTIPSYKFITITKPKIVEACPVNTHRGGGDGKREVPGWRQFIQPGPTAACLHHAMVKNGSDFAALLEHCRRRDAVNIFNLIRSKQSKL